MRRRMQSLSVILKLNSMVLLHFPSRSSLSVYEAKYLSEYGLLNFYGVWRYELNMTQHV